MAKRNSTKPREAGPTTSGLSEVQKAMIVVLGELEELVAQGYVARTSDFHYLTEDAMVIFRQLKSMGYQPSKEMMELAVHLFKRVEAGGEDD
jgi:hypothetical protein